MLAAALTLSGCGKQQATTYSAPKESAPTPGPAPMQPAMAAPAGAPVHWTTPEGWKEQPASGMRVGSFAVDKGGQHADVSIIPLGGVSGSELDNVNRWRGQVGLEPIDAAKLSESGEKVSVGGTTAALYDIAGKDPNNQQPIRILASILPSDGVAWFFKMIGPDALVEQEKPAFEEFLRSVHMQGGVAQEPTTAPGAVPTPNMTPMASALSSGAVSAGDKPTWEVPQGWQERAPSAIRAGSFEVTGENGAKADVSVIKLSGTAGGMLANINRWRNQVGLPPVDQAGLEKLVTTREIGGTKVTLADMAGQSMESGGQARMLVAIVPRGGSTWFYKMFGNDALVSQQKPAFIKFVESARYPNAS